MPIGAAAGGGGDPRLSITGNEKYEYGHANEETGARAGRKRKSLAIRDPSVKFEEYVES
jgi:hypothetical protein